MAEKEQDHAISMAKAAGDEQIRLNSRVLRQGDRGQIFGRVVAIGALGVSALAILKGQQWTASIIGGLDIVGLVAVFVTGKGQQGGKWPRRSFPMF